MRNSNATPPKYGAEGPPGGPEAWGRQQSQQSDIAKMRGRPGGGMWAGLMENINSKYPGGIREMIGAPPQQRQTQPNWSSGQGAVQWPGQGGGPPQGTPPMQSQPTQAQAASMPPQRPPQQYGMAGLGQAAGKGVQMMQAAALRRRGMQQEQ